MAYSFITWLITHDLLITVENPSGHLCLAFSLLLRAETISPSLLLNFNIQTLENKNQRESSIPICFLPDCLKPYLLSSDFLSHVLSLPKNYTVHASSCTHRGWSYSRSSTKKPCPNKMQNISIIQKLYTYTLLRLDWDGDEIFSFVLV